MSDEYIEEEEFSGAFEGRVFRRILTLIAPYKMWVVGFLLSVVVVSILDAYFTYLSKQIIDQGIVPGNRSALVSILLQYGGLIVVQCVAVFGFIYLTAVLGERVRYDLRQSMFNHLQALSLNYYSRTPVGWIMARVN
ncbi:MAG TPA: ABC transporter transmembrane domain-containing protein, partial [Anaerolineaceae bacterium]|nr:ABC transporter transmembrane domain-containing protein [Anaerolineaceae bacterium]